jgi:hypothetical protein
MNPELEDDELVLRDLRSRAINFEMIGRRKFGVTTNFLMPDSILNTLKRFGAKFESKHKEY